MLTATTILAFIGALGAANAATSDATSAGTISAAQVAQFAPGTHNCTSATAECLTAAEVVSMTCKAYKDQQIPNRNALIAILATISFESLDFKYCMNLAHPDAQGTYSQISLANLAKYGATLKPPRKPTNTTGDKPFIQGLCKNKQIAFETGFWYFQNGAFNASVRQDVEKNGDDAAYANYVTKGLSAPMTPERLQKFQLVKKILSVTGTPDSTSTTTNSTSTPTGTTTETSMTLSSTSNLTPATIQSNIPMPTPTVNSDTAASSTIAADDSTVNAPARARRPPLSPRRLALKRLPFKSRLFLIAPYS